MDASAERKLLEDAYAAWQAKHDAKRHEMFELYKIAIDEYRFEVRINWERMRYYLVVNSATIALATSLLKDARETSIVLLSGAIFLIGFFMTVLGIFAIEKGKEYYRETVYKKTLIERLLGFHEPIGEIDSPRATLAIGTTAGMRDWRKVLDGTSDRSVVQELFRNRVVSYFMWLLILSAGIDAAGSIYAASIVADKLSSRRAVTAPPDTSRATPDTGSSRSP